MEKSVSLWDMIVEAFREWRNGQKIKDEELIGREILDAEFIEIVKNENPEVIKELMETRNGISIKKEDKKGRKTDIEKNYGEVPSKNQVNQSTRQINKNKEEGR